MNDFGEERLPEELEAVAARLRAARAQADPLQFDQVKQRVIARCSSQSRRASFMKERLATIGTIFALVGGTGGAIAVGASSSHSAQHGAATAQYNSSKTKCRKGTHRVGNKCVKNGNKSKAGVRGQNNARSRKKSSANRGATRSPSTSGATRGFTG